MKFVIAFVALASVAAVNAAPGTFFGDTEENYAPLEQIQINAKKIKLAAADMEVTEGKLAALAEAADKIAEATTLLTDTADTAAYEAESLAFKHESA